MEGAVQMIAGYVIGTAIPATEDVVCTTTTQYAVTDCATTPAVNVGGITLSTANPIQVVIEGAIPVHFDAALTAIGDIVCLSTTTAGQGHDHGTAAGPTAGAEIGVIVPDAGTVVVAPANGAGSGTLPSVTLSTTLPRVQLHFR